MPTTVGEILKRIEELENQVATLQGQVARLAKTRKVCLVDDVPEPKHECVNCGGVGHILTPFGPVECKCFQPWKEARQLYLLSIRPRRKNKV